MHLVFNLYIDYRYSKSNEDSAEFGRKCPKYFAKRRCLKDLCQNLYNGRVTEGQGLVSTENMHPP